MSDWYLIAALVALIIIDALVILWLIKAGKIKLHPPGPASKIIAQRSGGDTTAKSDDDPRLPSAAHATTTNELDELRAFNNKNRM